MWDNKNDINESVIIQGEQFFSQLFNCGRISKFLLMIMVVFSIFFFLSSASAADVYLTVDEICDVSAVVSKYTADNNKIPSAMKVTNKTFNDEDYLYLATRTIVNANKGKYNTVKLVNINNPSPSGSLQGTLTKAQYVNLAGSINTYISNNNKPPAYVTYNGGNARYETLVYGFSNIIVYADKHGTLPSSQYFKNINGINSATASTDTVKPTSSSSLAGGWYNSAKSVVLTAKDNKDTAPKIEYKLNGVSGTPKAKTVTISLPAGSHSLVYRAVDNNNNLESWKTVNYYIDKVKPTVSTNLAAGWYNISKSVILTANDNLDSKPTLYYKVNNGALLNKSKIVTLSLAGGTHTIQYYSKDAAGNVGSTVTVKYTIDLNVPTVYSNLGGGQYTSFKSVNFTAKDNLDPNPTIYYRINNGAWSSKSKSTVLYLVEGAYNVQYYSKDLAGNVGSTSTVNYVINLNNSIIPLNYTITIPNYVNVTFDGMVYNNSSYVMKSGKGGIIKLPFSRELSVRVLNKTYIFSYSPVNGLHIPNNYTNFNITNGDSYFVFLNGTKPVKLNSLNKLPVNPSGILVKALNDLMTFTYYDYVKWDVNQFSVIYIGDNFLRVNGSFELIDFILNGINKSTIVFSDARYIFEDFGLRQQLHYNYVSTPNWTTCSYDKFTSN
ncbi:hypothetical protein [Methanobrevibacter curvatus]|nr:hypothetical protein [Methanobrevibacter curvatus]